MVRAASSPKGDAPPPSSEALPFHILLVEDDPDVALSLQDYLEMQGARVTCVDEGEAALTAMHDHDDIDIVLLDVMLPDISGFDVLETSQEIGFAAPVMMVTARGEHEDILRGLGLGAQDYIVKPFDVDDLIEHIRTLIGTSKEPADEPSGTHRIGNVKVNFDTGTVRQGEHELQFDELEMDLLCFLFAHRGQVVTRKRLLHDAWSIDQDHVSFSVSPEVVTQKLEKHIETLRQYIEPNPLSPRHIKTVYGLGYRFVQDAG